MSDLPGSWAEIEVRLAALFGGYDGEAIAREWIREALEVGFGTSDAAAIRPRSRRATAFQRLSGVLLALEDEGDFTFYIGGRAVVAKTFARYFQGATLAGPPWRLDPTEDLPSYASLEQTADFGGDALGAPESASPDPRAASASAASQRDRAAPTAGERP